MLEENKNIYIQIAERIPNWKREDKSTLIKNYCKAKSDGDLYNQEGYMAAIILRCWGVLTNFYRQPHSGRVYIEDFYDCLTEAVLTITNQPWLWENEYLSHTYVKTGETKTKINALYGKKDGPNIALTKCISSLKAGFYQSSNYDKRKLNYTAASVEAIVEDGQSIILPVSYDLENTVGAPVRDLIKESFKGGDYKKAFILEGIVYGDVFEYNEENREHTFSKKRLLKHLRHLDEPYCHIIASHLKLDFDMLNEASLIFRDKDTVTLNHIIDKTLNQLRNNSKLFDDLTPEDRVL